MKIVWASPPNLVYDQTPHYFQALFSAGAVYLRSRFPDHEVVTEAAGFHGSFQRVILRHFACHTPAEYLVVWARPWEAHAARDLANQVKQLSPGTKVLVWGEACSYFPHYFERQPFDLYAINGDPELVVADAIAAMERGDFYVLCPDNDVTPEIDHRRIEWAAADMTKNRPALSRWHPDYEDAFSAFMSKAQD